MLDWVILLVVEFEVFEGLYNVLCKLNEFVYLNVMVLINIGNFEKDI